MEVKTNRSKSKGFTLIEIHVVIGIILVLAALMFPIFKAAKEAGFETTSRSNLRQIHIALTQYAGDNNDQIAMAADGFDAVWYKNIGPFGWKPGEIHHPSMKIEDAGSFFIRSIGYAVNSHLERKSFASVSPNTVLACEHAPFGFTSSTGIHQYPTLAASLPDIELAKNVQPEFGIVPTPYPGKYFATGWNGKGLYLTIDGAVVKLGPRQVGFYGNEKPDGVSFYTQN